MRVLGVTLAVLGAVLLGLAAMLVLVNAKPVGLAGATKLGAYIGLGLLTLGLVSAVVAPAASESAEGA